MSASLVEKVIYLLPDSILLYPPFTGPRYLTYQERRHKKREQGKNDKTVVSDSEHELVNNLPFFERAQVTDPTVDFSVNILRRDIIIPQISIRPAKVEDCDDLVPMFQRHNVIIETFLYCI